MKRWIIISIFLMFIANNILEASDFKETKYSLEISISKCRMYLIGKENDSLRIIKEFSVGTPKVDLDTYPLGKGIITKIEVHPSWYPTAYTRWFFKNKKGIILPSEIPPGNPLNFMGAFKMHLSHSTYKGAIYRIHGNNDPSLIGKRVSGGCIRMHNEEGLTLVKMLSVGTEVDIKY